MFKATINPETLKGVTIHTVENNAVLASVVAEMGTLKIGRKSFKVMGLADAQAVYCEERDERDEGASTFPDGKLTLKGKQYRISYNGRIWEGTKYSPSAVEVFP